MGKRLGEIIVEGFKEFNDDLEKKGSISTKYNLRRVVVDLEPQCYSGDDVKRVREAIDASQTVFALLLGVSVRTLQKWERDENRVPPMAARFMDEINADPEHFITRLETYIQVKEAASEDEDKIHC